MVTHNPELAQRYSTRIINILDGRITGDSAPLSDAELSELEATDAKRLADAEAKKQLGAAQRGKNRLCRLRPHFRCHLKTSLPKKRAHNSHLIRGKHRNYRHCTDIRRFSGNDDVHRLCAGGDSFLLSYHP